VRLTVVDHPIAATRLTVLRDATTGAPAFRAALAELAQILVLEATRDLAVEPVPISTPVGPTTGSRLRDTPLLVPVLRAGLGMAEAAFALLPDAQMGFLGLARDEVTHEPRAYLESLPASLAGVPVLVLDPMLATGGSLVHGCTSLLARGATRLTVVCVLAAPEGLDRLAAAGLEPAGTALHVVTTAVDERLDERAFIVPGLGDAGDRQFGAV